MGNRLGLSKITQMNPTTPTPRTDSEWSSTSNGLRLHELCKQLERELAEKTNEVARLREENENLRGTLKSFVLVSPIEAERMERMEQNYDRIRELLERLCDSVAENWDEGIANYFREEANK